MSFNVQKLELRKLNVMQYNGSKLCVDRNMTTREYSCFKLTILTFF